MRPEGVVEIVPRNVAQFHATRWEGEENSPDLAWMADQFGWTVKYLSGRAIITGRHRKRVEVRPNSWVIALGVNGSVRIVNDRVFARDYEEVAQ